MRKIVLIIASLLLCGSIFAQHESDKYGTHWPDFDGDLFYNQDPTVAFVKIGGDFVAASDNWADLEVAAFVGDECRGHTFMKYFAEEGDPYPIIELSVYYTEMAEEVSFKIYDHARGIEYSNCFANVQGEPITIRTGEDHTELYYDYNTAIILRVE